MASDIILDIGASTLEATKEIAKFQKAASKSLGAVEDSFGSLKTLAIAVAGAFAGVKIVSFLGSAIDAAAESEEAFNHLGISMQLAGRYSKEAADSMVAFSKQVQATTVYEDDAVIAAAAHIETLARLDKDGLQKATAAAVDLSAALGIDLTTASNVVARAASGNTQALGRMGIEVKKGATDAETFANVLETIGDRFGGVAAAQVNTYSAAIKQAANMYGDLKEQIGGVIIENKTVVESVKSTSGYFGLLGKIIEENKGAVQEWITGGIIAMSKVIPIALDGIALLVKGLGYVVDAAASVVKYWVGFLKVVSETRVVSAIVEAFATVVGMLWSGVVKLLAGFVKLAAHIPGIQRLFEGMGIDVDGLGESLVVASEELSSFAINTDFSQALTSGLQAAESTMNDLGETASTAGEAMAGVLTQSADYAREATKRLAEANDVEKDTAKIKATVVKATDEEAKANDRLNSILDDIIKSEREIRLELEKRGKTGRQLADIERRSAEETAAHWRAELAAQKALTPGNEKLIADYLRMADARALVAKQSLGVSGIAIGDLGFNDKAMYDLFSDAAQGAIDNLRNSLQTMTLGDIGSGIGGAILSALEAGGTLIRDIFSGDFNKMLDEVSAFIETIPETVSALLDRLPVFIDKILASAPGILDKAISMLPRVAEMLAQSAPAMTAMVLDALLKLIETLPDILGPIIRSIPKVFAEALSRLPQLIESLLAAAGQVIAEIVRILPDVLSQWLEAIPKLWVAFIDGFAEACGPIVEAIIDAFITRGGAVKIAISLAKALITMWPMIWVAAANGVVTVAKAFGAALSDMLKGAQGNAIANGFGAKLKEGFLASMAASGAVFAGYGAQIWGGLSTSLTQFGTMFADLGKSIYGGLLAKILEATQDFLNVGGNIFNGFWDSVLEFWGEFEKMGHNIAVGFQNGIQGIGDVASGGSFPEITGLDVATGGVNRLVAAGATGGTIPPGYDDDSYFMRAKSGEELIQSGVSDRLARFLDREDSGRPTTIILQVGEKQLASIMLNLNRQGFRTA